MEAWSSFLVTKKATADVIKCISSTLIAGHNHGLEVYVPRTRLKPAGPLVLDPLPLKFRPFLKLVIDEEATGVGAANFMWSCAGVRGFHETDMCHRRDNDTHNAIKRSELQPAQAKLVFLSNLNKGPWNVGAWLQKKAEVLALYLATLKQDPKEMAMYVEGLAFDQGLDMDVLHSGEDAMPMVNFGISKWLDMTGFQKRSGSVASLVLPGLSWLVVFCGVLFLQAGAQEPQRRDDSCTLINRQPNIFDFNGLDSSTICTEHSLQQHWRMVVKVQTYNSIQCGCCVGDMLPVSPIACTQAAQVMPW